MMSPAAPLPASPESRQVLLRQLSRIMNLATIKSQHIECEESSLRKRVLQKALVTRVSGHVGELIRATQASLLRAPVPSPRSRSRLGMESAPKTSNEIAKGAPKGSGPLKTLTLGAGDCSSQCWSEERENERRPTRTASGSAVVAPMMQCLTVCARKVDRKTDESGAAGLKRCSGALESPEFMPPLKRHRRTSVDMGNLSSALLAC